MIDLRGHTALITGGTQGVGAAIAASLSVAGCNVLLQGLAENEAAIETLKTCRENGVIATAVYCDLCQPIENVIPLLMDFVASSSSQVDLLVNNVGVFIDKPFLENDIETFQRTFQLNVAVGYFLTQAIVRKWLSQSIHGRILFTGSINGLLAEPNHTAYDASKAAVAGLVRSLCVTLAPLKIRVNSLAPGLVQTPLTAPALNADENAMRWMELHTPNGQVPEANVCGGLAAFLLSDLASHIHGQTIYVDGGMSAWQQPDRPSKDSSL